MSNSKRWFITGISSGIGEALARAAVARGDTVIGTARSAAAVETFSAIAPGRSIGVQLDVSQPAEVKRAVDEAISSGPLDVVVSNAGQSIFGAFEETSIEEAKALLDVNVFGPWAVAQAVLPHFRERGSGQLVHMSSGCGVMGMPGLSAYCASKFALEGFSEALAAEVSQFGVRLLIVEPGAVKTKFISHGTQETANRMAEYAFLSGSGKTALEGFYQDYAAAPDQVVDAVLRAIDSPDQQLRLIVGDDVREPIRQRAQQTLDLINAG